jgi:signal transduction histidine kinase
VAEGTGLYADDAVVALRETVDDNISLTLQLIIALALGTVVIVRFFGARMTQ